MWKCTNCHHVEMGIQRPERCPVCGVQADKLVPHEVPRVKGTKTLVNLKEGFVAESQAHLRNLAFAMKADQEGYPQIASLFRAVAEAEGIHAFNHLRLLEAVADTQENLEAAFERENLAGREYPRFIIEANREGDAAVARVFGYTRDVEHGHARLYKNALERMSGEFEVEYHVCAICGYVSDSGVPDQCPICGAPGERFRRVA